VRDDLFHYALEEHFDSFAPLAARMRPRSLDELVGQSHLVGPRGPLRALITSDQLRSIILWGPAGTGKTSLASIIARMTEARFQRLSAVNATVAQVRTTIAEAEETLGATGRKTILFLDEIHRFNKGQQDALLPAVEDGIIVLIGATTENPFFEINSPLLSRSLVFRLEPLSRAEVRTILKRALEGGPRGLGDSGVEVPEAAIGHILDRAGGDARAALNALETCVAAAVAEGEETVSPQLAESVLPQAVLRYDRAADAHYDTISAFIKSMRAGDSEAAVWWLAGMLEAGEDPRFIARRMVIFASEDVGNADPMALVVAVSAAHALELVGLPEARLNLAQAAIYLATAPKSRAAAEAIGRAGDRVSAQGPGEVPAHLKNRDDVSGRVGGRREHARGSP
jgi:putative ATPase